MSKDLEAFLKEGHDAMEKAIEHLHLELTKIRTGKASPAMLSGIMVEYYGSTVPISQVANVAIADSKTLSIQPWDKSMLSVIEQSIFGANIGLTPQNDGEFIRINIPALTEERRKELVKFGKHLGEEAKVSLRNTRHKLMDFIKEEIKNGYPEDAGKRRESEVQNQIEEYSKNVDELVHAKEVDIMTI